MPWYGWLGWILMLASVAGIALYFVFRKKPPANIAEAQLKLRQMEDLLIETKRKVTEEANARKEAERVKTEVEMRLLRTQQQLRLAELRVREKNDYEKAKMDPSSGVNDMRDFLGVDSDSGKSKPG